MSRNAQSTLRKRITFKAGASHTTQPKKWESDLTKRLFPLAVLFFRLETAMQCETLTTQAKTDI